MLHLDGRNVEVGGNSCDDEEAVVNCLQRTDLWDMGAATKQLYRRKDVQEWA